MPKNHDQKTPRIKPQLMIYPSVRGSNYSYDEFYKKKLKYRMFSRKSDNDPGHFLKRQSALPMKRYISNISHFLTNANSRGREFLKFLSRARRIRKLDLSTPAFHWGCEREEYLYENFLEREQKLKKTVRRIFVLCSKVQNVQIHIFNNTHSFGNLVFPFKYLLIARSLKYLDCSLKTKLFPNFTCLVDYLVRANHRGLEPTCSFEFDPRTVYKVEGKQYVSLAELQEIIQNINALNKNSSLKFRLNFDPFYREFDRIISFTKIFQKLPNITELTIERQLHQCVPKFLKNISNNAQLTKLSLELLLSSEYNKESIDPLGYLSRFIRTAKSLKTLRLTFEGFEESTHLNPFVEELKGCLELSSLSLAFENCPCADPSLLTTLTQSLANLPKFIDLAIYHQSDPTRKSNSGMQSFFKGIQQLNP